MNLGITHFRALDYIKDDEALAAYVGAFVEQERERCAALCEGRAASAASYGDTAEQEEAAACAAAIRQSTTSGKIEG